MPKYTPSDEEMEEAYGGSKAPVESPESESKSAESVDEENAGASEILIDKSKLPEGTKVGETCTFRVAQDFGDEVSLEYVKEGEETETEEPGSEVGKELSALSGE